MDPNPPDCGRAARSAAAESVATDDAEPCVFEAATRCVGQDPSGEGSVQAVPPNRAIVQRALHELPWGVNVELLAVVKEPKNVGRVAGALEVA
ncbi:MAG: hypothetical protein JW751_00830 [Polyangiaceae bacterium]|nr:hypothetical protein [Polyangiaceae bacterium]